MGQEMKIDKTLDIKGIVDHRQTAVTEEILQLMVKGQTLKVIADNAGSRRSIPILCDQMGCSLLSVEEGGGIVSFIIQK